MKRSFALCVMLLSVFSAAQAEELSFDNRPSAALQLFREGTPEYDRIAYGVTCDRQDIVNGAIIGAVAGAAVGAASGVALSAMEATAVTTAAGRFIVYGRSVAVGDTLAGAGTVTSVGRVGMTEVPAATAGFWGGFFGVTGATVGMYVGGAAARYRCAKDAATTETAELLDGAGALIKPDLSK